MTLFKHALRRSLWLFAPVALLAACSSQPTANDFPTDPEAHAPGIFMDIEGRAVLPAGMTLRPVVAKGLAVTKRGEGWRNKLYNDAAGYCTVGYGHLIKLARCDGTEPWQSGLSEAEGEKLLVEDMRDAQIAVMLAVKTRLTDTQYAALCDFVFNVGGGNFRKSRLLQVVNAGQHDQVATQLMRWSMAGGKEVPGLLRRRQMEIDLYYDGLLASRATPSAGEDLSPIDIRTGR